MSLHGTIEINNRIIGGWTAQRITNDHAPVIDDDLTSTYKCEVYTTHGPTRRFEVEHRYGDGAVVLAALVLSKGGAE